MKSILTLAFLLFFSSTPSLAGVIPGVEGPFLNIVDNKLHVDLKFTMLNLEGGIDIGVPKLPNSSMHVTANEIDGGTLVTLKLSPEDFSVIKESVMERAFYLPDGRAIPRIPGGALKPALRLDLKPVHKKLSFYYHESLFGFWVPLNLNYSNFPVNGADITLKWKGKNIGFIAFIGAEKDKKPGFAVFLRLKEIEQNPELMARLMKNK